MREIRVEIPNSVIGELRIFIENLCWSVRTDERGDRNFYCEKQLVGKIEGVKFEIYAKEHPPPHFHVLANDFKASYALDDGRLLTDTKAPRRVKKIVELYFQQNGDKLREFWNETRPDNCPVGPIEL